MTDIVSVPAALIHLPANGLDSLRRDEPTRSLTCARRVSCVLDMCAEHGRARCASLAVSLLRVEFRW